MIPFLKWAGGKRWLVKNHSIYIPRNFNTYIEPFLGSGAVFFYLQPRNSILNDLNRDLILAYQGLRERPEEVVNLLKTHHRCHCKEYYYKLRSQAFKSLEEHAAKFIYLNKTCYNGLYRVNLKGEFNVPIGTKNKVYDHTDDYFSISRLLESVEFYSVDFEQIIDMAEEGDFVFADPPYSVTHNENGFIKYNEKLFSWLDQQRLAKALKRAALRGVQVLSTNAYHNSLKELYQESFTLTAVSRASAIAGKSESRGHYQELIISNSK